MTRTEAEQTKLLESFDRLGSLADVDSEAVERLLRDIAAAEEAVLPLQEDPVVARLAAEIAAEREGVPEPLDGRWFVQMVTATVEALVAEDPERLWSAGALIACPGGRRVLLVVDEDLPDVVAELRRRHEAGEAHLLDPLSAGIWEGTGQDDPGPA